MYKFVKLLIIAVGRLRELVDFINRYMKLTPIWLLLHILIIKRMSSALCLGVRFRRHLHKGTIKSCMRLSSSRPPTNGLSLDSYLASTQPELLISHLESRKSTSEMVQKVHDVKNLRDEAVKWKIVGDTARNTRKTLSRTIGQLMKEKKTIDAEKLKLQVESANIESHTADERLAKVEQRIHKIMAELPNLLEDRYASTIVALL